MKSMSLQKGFTLVEILIAVALVAIMGGIVTYGAQRYIEGNKKSAAASSLKVMREIIEQYNDDVGEYPQSLSDLVVKPSDEKAAAGWNGPYITAKNNRVPEDPWKKPYVYNLTEGGEHPYELYSYGSKQGKNAPKSGWIDAWKI